MTPTTEQLRKVYVEAHKKAIPDIVQTSEDLHNAELAGIDAGISAVLKALDITRENVSANQPKVA